jgi:hypothetical protein
VNAPDDRLYSGVKALVTLDVVDATELLSRPFQPPQFLIRYLTPARAIVLLTGDTGGAKTALAIHLSVALATGQPVAGRFSVDPNCDGSVLYCNGEMSPDVLNRYVREAIAGVGAELKPARLFFEGIDGVATFRFSDATRDRLEELVSSLRPSLVVLDTQRALLVEDENDGVEVRRAFSWLRSRIVNEYGASVLVLHHLRKIGQTSNNDRERVSGHRDILASVDVHLAAISRGELPMHALKIGKTRFPVDGIAAGAEWPIEARLDFVGTDEPNRSVFIAGDIDDVVRPSGQAVDDAVTQLRARFELGEPLTRADVNARAGNPKRAWDTLRDDGSIVEVGRRGRQPLYTLAELANERGHANVVNDSDADHATRKAPSRKGMSLVSPRPRSDHAGTPEARDAARSLSAATPEPTERGHGQDIYRDHDHDHAREISVAHENGELP